MSKEKSGNLLYVKIFMVVFAIVIFIALIFRLYGEFSQRQFTQNSFNVLIVSDKYVGIIGVDESESRFSSVVVTGSLNEIKSRNTFLQSINFGIPVHAFIYFPPGYQPQDPTKSFFNFNNIQSIISNGEIDIRNITLFDWFRLHNVTKSIDDNRVGIKTYATLDDLSTLIADEEENFFRDSSIANRKTSIQVINGTGINGLGNRIGNMFSRTGYNVVSVIAGEIEESVIYYYNDASYEDAQFIAKSFNIPLQKSTESSVANISILIGENSELDLENLAY